MDQDYEALGKVFVAGTGRSGTTLMHRVLGSHPAGFLVPFETKFIVEGDGLLALIPALCENFSVTAADLALIRFYEMMGAELPRRIGPPPRDISEFGQGVRQGNL